MGKASAAEQAVISDDTLLHAALASMPYGFTIWNEQLRLVLWNETYLAMYHLPRERIIAGMTLRNVAEVSITTGDHDDMSLDEVYALYLERFGAEGATVVEHGVRERTIRSTNTRMAGLGWVVTHQDVTGEVEQQRLAAAREAALAQQNMRFDVAVNNMPQGLAMFGPDQRLVICSDIFARLYGLPPALVEPGVSLDEILQYRHENGLVPDGEQRAGYHEKRLRIARERGRTVRFIESERGRTISVTHQPMPDGGWVSTHQDITEQRHKEDIIQARTLELEIQNIRFDAAINNMMHGLCMFDAESRLIVCNRQYGEMYGLPPELTRPGTLFWDMLDDGEKTGMISIADRETRFQRLGAVISAGQTVKDNLKMMNGRVIAVLHQPMAGGGWISTHEDVTEQHHHQELIRHLARHDALTDLPNRVLFREEMAKLEARLKRREGVAVLCIDLDHFKEVNDTLGHGVGDAVLVNVAKRLREASRESDVVARLGGDEFAVVIGPLDDPRHAGLIADRIVKSVAQPMTVEGHRIVIGASIGVALAPLDGSTAETLLKNADLALYRAKSEGRGTYHFFERSMDDASKHRQALELGMRAALARGEFRLVFQPVIRLADRKISALEALVRWDHPERGLLAPAEFVPVAEETGIIVQIDEWVLRQACLAAARWPDDIGIAINLSAAQFRHRGDVEDVASALAEAGIAADRLELEVSEQALANDSDAVFKTLRRLSAMGVRLAVDDFGSGHGSLGYLRTFQFDRIKVDCGAVGGVPGGGDAMAMAKALVGLGRSLGLATTVKGIETEAQLDEVSRHGCNEAQGFLFSPALPASGIDALLGALRINAARRLDAAG